MHSTRRSMRRSPLSQYKCSFSYETLADHPIGFYDASEGFSDATEGRIENPSSEVGKQNRGPRPAVVVVAEVADLGMSNETIMGRRCKGRLDHPSRKAPARRAERGGYNHCSHGALSPCHPREEKPRSATAATNAILARDAAKRRPLPDRRRKSYPPQSNRIG